MSALRHVPVVLAAIAIAGCGSQSVRTEVPAQTRSPAPRTSMELRVVVLPRFGNPVAVDDTGERWIAGGVRFEMHDGEPTFARVLSTSELTATRVGGAWLFVDAANGRVLRSAEFLGDLAPHGAADAHIAPCVGQPSDRLFLRGDDGRLYVATADEPLSPVSALAQSIASSCALDDAANVFVSTNDGLLRSSDGGRSWAREASSAAANAAFSSGMHARLGRPRASAAELVGPMQLLLAQLGVPLEPSDIASAELPGRSCEHLGPRIASCDSGVFVVRADGEWQHVAAPDPRGASSIASPDGARALLGWGCQGEHGHLCWVDTRAATARTIDRALDLRDAAALGDRAVHVLSEDAMLVTVDLDTGTTHARNLGESLDRPFVAAVTAFTEGGMACTLRGLDDDAALRVVLVSVDGATVTDVALPDGTVTAGMLDAMHGVAIDREGRVLRTDDAGDHWTDSGAREVDPSGEGMRCRTQACGGEGFVAWMVPSTTPAPSFALERPSGPARRIAGYELAETGGTGHGSQIVHEVRQRKLWVSVTWETSLGLRTSQGFLRGHAHDGDEWRVVFANEHAAIARFYDENGLVYVLARAGGRVSLLPSDIGDDVPMTTALDGSIVIASSAMQIVRPNGRIEVLAGARPDGLRFLPDGRIERAAFGATLSGAVRAVTESEGASVIALAGARPCEASDGIVARWWLSEARIPFEIRDGRESGPHTSATIDVDAEGRACVRSIMIGTEIFEAAPGGTLVGPDVALRPAEP